jgi:hypothetical protein
MVHGECHRSTNGSKVRLQTPAAWLQSYRKGFWLVGRCCWWWRRRITGKWAQRTTSFDVLVEVWLHACLPWPYKDMRVQLHAPVAWPQGKVAPVPTEKEDGWVPVSGPDVSRSWKFTDPFGNRGSKQRQHIRQSRPHNSVLFTTLHTIFES